MSAAEGSASLPYPKLPLWNTICLSYSTYFYHFIDALRTSWLWLVVVAALTGVVSWQKWSWIATLMANPPSLLQMLNQPPEPIAFRDIYVLLTLFAGVSIAVAWHRLVILGQDPGLSASNVATRNFWRYAGIAIALFVPFALASLPTYLSLPLGSGGALLPPGFFMRTLLSSLASALLYVVGTAIVFRLILLLPARAIGDLGLTFRQVWDRTRGNTWRMILGIAACVTPPMLPLQLATLAMIRFPNRGIASEDFAAQMTTHSVIFAVCYLLILPISIGFLSHAYRHFFQAPLEFADS
jgi:hypothetical protein